MSSYAKITTENLRKFCKESLNYLRDKKDIERIKKLLLFSNYSHILPSEKIGTFSTTIIHISVDDFDLITRHFKER